MKRWSEGKAAVAAIVVSTTTLLGTYGIARVMHTASFSMQMPDLLSSAQAEKVPPVTTADYALGRHLFRLNCAHCHGDDAHGGEGPDLYDLHKSNARVHQVITTGIKGEMPSFRKKFNESDIQALTAYLRTLHN
jgi:mono/diheme cytochrome c family protein